MVTAPPVIEAAPTGSGHLLRGAYSLIANTAVTSALGMGFWVAAARLFPNTTVGRDTVLISTMIELSTLCQLNMGNAIIRFLPDLGGRSVKALGSAYAISGALALVVGTGFVLLSSSISSELNFLGASPVLAIGYVAVLVCWGLFTLQDAALTATRKALWIPVENGVFGVLKLAALPLLLTAGVVDGVFVAWAIPMVLLLVPVSLLIFRRVLPKHASTHAPQESSLQRFGTGPAVSFVSQDYLASVFTQACLTVLPLLVIGVLGAKSAAYFAMPFTITMAFDTFAYSASSSLVVEGTLDPERLRELTGVFIRRVLVLIVPLAAVLAAAAPLVMLPFGHSYANHGAGVLRLLLAASIFRVVIALFSALSRARGRGLRLGVIELALLVIVLAPAIPLAHSNGIEGVALAWLGANAVICLAVLPWMRRFLGRPSSTVIEN